MTGPNPLDIEPIEAGAVSLEHQAAKHLADYQRDTGEPVTETAEVICRVLALYSVEVEIRGWVARHLQKAIAMIDDDPRRAKAILVVLLAGIREEGKSGG